MKYILHGLIKQLENLLYVDNFMNTSRYQLTLSTISCPLRIASRFSGIKW